MNYGRGRQKHREDRSAGSTETYCGKSHRQRKIAGAVCIGIGFLMVAGVITQLLWNYHKEKELLTNLSDQLGIRVIAAAAFPENKTDTSETYAGMTADAEADTAASIPGADTGMGVLSIPRIKLNVALAEGVDSKTLRTAVGHVPGTAMPGDDAGNCAIAGHRNYSFGRFFNRLDEVEAGDLITITVTDGVTWYYEVAETFVVEPEDVSVLEASEDAELTLITCTPIYIASHRLIVRARLIEEQLRPDPVQ